MALRVRDRLINAGDHDVELVAGSGGVFEIEVDGVLRFSKRALRRFPTDAEIDALVPA
jgi:predicted Rdx family selenoprotein